MSKVNSPRSCAICGREFYPSISQSLFICDDLQCRTEYNAGMEELADLNDKLAQYDEKWDSFRYANELDQ